MSFTISYNIKAIDQFSAVSKKVTESANKIDLSMRKMSKGIKIAAKAYTRLNVAGQGVDNTSEKIHAEQQRLLKSLNEVNRATRRVERSTRSASKSYDNLATSTKKANKSASEHADKMRMVGAGMSRAGRTITTRFTLPMVAAATASVKMAMDFNENMAAVATLIPGQTARVKQLKTEIQDLSVQTGISTEDLSKGAYAAISAWGDSADTMGRMNVVARASKAGLASTEETLGLLTSLTEIYGDKSAAATEHLADLAFVTNKLAIKAPFADMAATMGKVAPLAKQIGVSQEQLFATMTAAAGVTGNVAEVSTQMSALYTGIIKETPQMAAVVKKTNRELGTSFGTAAEAMETMGTMDWLRQMKKHTEGTKGFAAALGGRKEGLVLSLALLEGRAGKYNEALQEMTQRSGQMEVAFNEVTNGINAQGEKWKRTKARMMVFAQRMGDRLLPVAERLMDKLEPILNWLTNMDDSTFEAGLALVAFTVKMGLLFTAVGKVIKLKAGFSAFLGTMGSGAAGAQDFGAALNAPITKVGLMKGGIKGLAGKMGLLAGAFAVGHAAGTALWDGVIKPALNNAERLVTTLSNATAKLKTTDMDKMTIEQLQTKKRQIKTKYDQMGLWEKITMGDDYERSLQAGAETMAELDVRINRIKQAQEEFGEIEGGRTAGHAWKDLVGGGAQKAVTKEEPRELKITLETKDKGGVVEGVKVSGQDDLTTVNTGKNVR